MGLLDALGIERTDLVGNSFGGGLSLALAIRHPERVRRLVLIGSAGVSFPLTEGLDAVWGYSHEGYEHTVTTHINRLRAKVEADPMTPRYILTVRGAGYKMRDVPA